MGVTEYAQHRNCGLFAVQRAIAEGRIPITDDNRIHVEEADKTWSDSTDVFATRPSGLPQLTPPPETHFRRPRSTEAVPGITYTDARALREVYDVQRRQLELQVRRGELVDRADVEREAQRLYTNLKGACLNLPARLAAQLAAETDEVNVREILEDALRRIFEDFAAGEKAEKAA